jgi:sigma-B regulation protein RsbU (phosphoserine phosphatase)
MLPGFIYREATCELGEGDFLLCYTDGITEAQSDAGEEFSEVRLQELARRLSDAPLDSMLDGSRAAAQLFTGSEQFEDDLTMLALRRMAAV